MRLFAKPVPHSNIVGGGLMLCSSNGQAHFIVNFMGAAAGITPAETKALSEQFAHFVNNHDVVVPDRTEENCPGHVASARDPKICGRCGTHIDSMRPDDDQP
jgi:hypothetical protein